MKKNPLHEEEFRKKLLDLKQKDPDGFTDLVYSTLVAFPDSALEDDSPIEKKIKALTKMMKHYEGTEMFERCAFLLDLLNKIKDEKRSIRNNE